jgi:hypothetical protein
MLTGKRYFESTLVIKLTESISLSEIPEKPGRISD